MASEVFSNTNIFLLYWVTFTLPKNKGGAMAEIRLFVEHLIAEITRWLQFHFEQLQGELHQTERLAAVFRGINKYFQYLRK